ncbi:MAG TPA: type 1 glutamine amidotransferase [Pseudorhodoplanes sp.]|jgi:GMP synthase (glutamine-hydrolysing)|nr:type 1 glutamine amidotransferase [Pseudorhodoplanes sp.]
MSPPRLLVVEGNTADGRALITAAGGRAPSEGYADLLRELLPGVVVDICYPADAGANLPDRGGLEGYDGVAITGSALNVYDGGPQIARQIDLTRAVLEAKTPLFGSCWGLQLITVAAGGSVRKNPKGREIGFGRRIRLTAAGRGHNMFAGKDEVFNAITVHLDEVETLAPGTQVLATNATSQVQAAEIKCGEAVAWGVQYHPEYSLRDIAATMRRYGRKLVEEKFFVDEKSLVAHAAELDSLHDDPDQKWIAWKHALDRLILDKSIRVKEIANWIDHQVKPVRMKRGRG